MESKVIEGKELEIYSNGIVHCSVCTNMESKALIENLVNARNPTLIWWFRWRISKELTFKTGEPNPCECKDKPGFKHYLMVC